MLVSRDTFLWYDGDVDVDDHFKADERVWWIEGERCTPFHCSLTNHGLRKISSRLDQWLCSNLPEQWISGFDGSRLSIALWKQHLRSLRFISSSLPKAFTNFIRSPGERKYGRFTTCSTSEKAYLWCKHHYRSTLLNQLGDCHSIYNGFPEWMFNFLWCRCSMLSCLLLGYLIFVSTLARLVDLMALLIEEAIYSIWLIHKHSSQVIHIFC